MACLVHWKQKLRPVAIASASLEVKVMHKHHRNTTRHGKLYLQMICHQPLLVPGGSLMPLCHQFWNEGVSDLRRRHVGQHGSALFCNPWDTALSLAISQSPHQEDCSLNLEGLRLCSSTHIKCWPQTGQTHRTLGMKAAPVSQLCSSSLHTEWAYSSWILLLH